MKTLSFTSMLILFLFGAGSMFEAQCQKKIVFDNFEDGNRQNSFGQSWQFLNDSAFGGNSFILQATDSASFAVFDNDVKSCVAQFNYQMKEGAKYPFVAARVSAPSENTGLLNSMGIEFWHKGDGFEFVAVQSNLPGGQSYAIEVPKSDEWQRVSFYWNDCKQPDWAIKHNFELDKLTHFSLFKGMPAGSKGSFCIDNISLIVPNRQMLANTIEKAENMHIFSIEGTEVGEYRPVARRELERTIDQATVAYKNLNNGATAFRSEINNLLSGMENFENSVINEASLFENFESQGFGRWDYFNDKLHDGTSGITAFSVVETADVSGLQEINETLYCLEAEFELVKNQPDQIPFVGFYINTLEHPQRHELVASRGIEIMHKGDACELLLGLTSIKDFDDYYVKIPASDKWEKHVFTWDKFKQHGWGEPKEFDTNLIDEVKIIVKGGQSQKGRILIDEIQLLAPEQINKTGI